MKRNTTLYQVDAFSSVPFKGNPAGVMILDEAADPQWMQNIAMEMNLSETAFVLKNGDIYEIRYFTPAAEVPLCGHATLASAHVMYQLGIVDERSSIHFKAKGGDLIVHKKDALITMDFPVYSLSKTNIPPQFHQIIGFQPVEIFTSMYGWTLAVAGTEEHIKNARPDFQKMVETGLGHLIITAPSKADDIDFVVRCFAPTLGVNEDPVTGSAHCALMPYWSQRTGQTELHSLQVSQRTGHLFLKMNDNRVEISGHAVTVFRIEMF